MKDSQEEWDIDSLQRTLKYLRERGCDGPIVKRLEALLAQQKDKEVRNALRSA